MKLKSGQTFIQDHTWNTNKPVSKFSITLKEKIRRQPRWTCYVTHIATGTMLGVFEILECSLDLDTECFRFDPLGTFKGMVYNEQKQIENKSIPNSDPHRYLAQITEILLWFDWDKVHKAMVALNWTWRNGVPSELNLVQESIRHLHEAIRYCTTSPDTSFFTGSGGLQVGVEDNILTLRFVVSDWTADYLDYKS